MIDPFSTIAYGPFASTYHNDLVDERFKANLQRYLRAELLPQVSIAFAETDGRLTAAFNDQKYCGPHSAIRNIFDFEFRFGSGAGSEHLQTQLVYSPADGTFGVRHNKPLIFWTAERKRRKVEDRQRIEALCREILAGQAVAASCPICGAVARVINADALFDVSCPNHCFNYNFHRDPKTREFMHGHFFMNDRK